jgi:Xaa-Pro aminopeptidase
MLNPQVDSLLNQLDGFLITDPLNIRYLTNFQGLSPNEREAYVLVTTNTLHLLTHSLYIDQARQLPNSTVELIGPDMKLSDYIKKIFASGNQVGFEAENLTVNELQHLKLLVPGISLVPTTQRVEQLRMHKNPTEIGLITEAAQLTDDCYQAVLPHLIPGVTEVEIAWEIETYFRKKGATSAFSPIVAFGRNTSYPHYHPQTVELTPNDLILLDFGAAVDGYCADMTRMLFSKKNDERLKQTYLILKQAQEKAIELLTEGILSGATLDQITRDFIHKHGYEPYAHSLGHSLGLAIHEAPRLSIHNDEPLKSNTVITIEPGIYIAHQYGMRLEDLVLITDTGIDILSQTTKDLVYW